MKKERFILEPQRTTIYHIVDTKKKEIVETFNERSNAKEELRRINAFGEHYAVK